MLQFQLFRVRLVQQMALFGAPTSPAELLSLVIQSKHSQELRKGHVWHVGNIEFLDEGGVYFALGRTTTARVETFDEAAGNFVDQEYDAAPYTHVILDLRSQVVAISGKSKLAPTIPGIARQLERLLNGAPLLLVADARFAVSPINDPEDFLTHLREAYAIKRFAVTFRIPNPWDVDKDFHAPLEKLLAASEGEKGKAILEGENLSVEPLEVLATSAAALGDDAEALIKTGEGKRAVKKVLRGNPVTCTADQADSTSEKVELLNKVRETYNRVRHHPSSE